MRGLLKGLAVPTIMYGLEVLDIEGKEKRGLEIVQHRAARKGLRANRNVVTEDSRGEMGWSTFQERIDQSKIQYRIRLEYMNNKRWARKIFKWKGRKSSFRKETNRAMKCLDMKIVNNGEEIDIKIKGEKLKVKEKYKIE